MGEGKEEMKRRTMEEKAGTTAKLSRCDRGRGGRGEGGRGGRGEGGREGGREGGKEGGREGGRERGREGRREGGREGGREGEREEGREGGRKGGREEVTWKTQVQLWLSHSTQHPPPHPPCTPCKRETTPPLVMCTSYARESG